MTNLSPTLPSVSANAGSIHLRQRITEALADYLDQNTATDIAERLGCAVSTVTRRETELGTWSASDLFSLALHDHDLAAAICAYLSGQQKPEGHGLAIRSDLVVEVANSAKITGKVAAALGDGQISIAEARGVLNAINERRKHEDERLIPDLTACIRSIA